LRQSSVREYALEVPAATHILEKLGIDYSCGGGKVKEESVLFPYIVQMEEAAVANQTLPPPPFRTVQNPVRVMMAEHDAAGYILGRMREASSDYAVPPDGCITYKTFYSALTALEVDLHQHIHLENNILFPRAVELEDMLRSI
jgi:regulator of cell morphogenesis and NO signaling